MLTTQEERKSVASVHLKHEKNDPEGWPGLYCYDIQLDSCVQRKGLDNAQQRSMSSVSTVKRTSWHKDGAGGQNGEACGLRAPAMGERRHRGLASAVLL